MSQQFIDGFKPSGEQLQEATLKWASDRGIIQNGKAITQVQKLASEVGELMDNIAKDRDIKDDVGDCIVVMVNIAGILGINIHCSMVTVQRHNINHKPTWSRNQVSTDILSTLGTLAHSIHCDAGGEHYTEIVGEHIMSMFMHLSSLLLTYKGFDLIDCWLHAYNDIKDRRGYLNENGNFIKEGDVE